MAYSVPIACADVQPAQTSFQLILLILGKQEAAHRHSQYLATRRLDLHVQIQEESTVR